MRNASGCVEEVDIFLSVRGVWISGDKATWSVPFRDHHAESPCHLSSLADHSADPLHDACLPSQTRVGRSREITILFVRTWRDGGPGQVIFVLFFSKRGRGR